MDVEGVDHVHIEVADRDRAADWYERVLGLRRDRRLATWAEDPQGPLILSTKAGAPALALFGWDAKARTRDATIAFRVDGRAFMAFLEKLPRLDLAHRSERGLDVSDVVDHDVSWSIYLVDPDGNPIEVTTYDHAEVTTRLDVGFGHGDRG